MSLVLGRLQKISLNLSRFRKRKTIVSHMMCAHLSKAVAGKGSFFFSSLGVRLRRLRRLLLLLSPITTLSNNSSLLFTIFLFTLFHKLPISSSFSVLSLPFFSSSTFSSPSHSRLHNRATPTPTKDSPWNAPLPQLRRGGAHLHMLQRPRSRRHWHQLAR